jgi:hypothetical protein
MRARTLVSLVIIGVLLGVAVGAEVELGRIPREDPLGRELLYLPSPEMLKIMSLGNPGLAADILYLWSIQYYSLFQPDERFLYLETIYNLITDLDPLYFDAYRIGALIMGIQTGGDQAQLKKSVRRLFDKGLENLPGSWQLAEAAAWDLFMRFQDQEAALHYAEIAAAQPDAPGRIKRMVGVWRDKKRVWTIDDSIEYWKRAVDDAEDEYDRTMCASHLYDALVARDRRALEAVLAHYSDRYGSCAESWEELIEAGLIREVPVDLVGKPYGIESSDCTIVAFKKIRDL